MKEKKYTIGFIKNRLGESLDSSYGLAIYDSLGEEVVRLNIDSFTEEHTTTFKKAGLEESIKEDKELNDLLEEAFIKLSIIRLTEGIVK